MAGTDYPKTIGKYTVIGRIGRGAMGVVYKARDPEIGRTVAIKVLKPITASHVFSQEASLERFRIEARSAGNLRHPNVITIFEVNTDSASPYIVMDFVEGEPLDRRLNRLEKLNPRDALQLISQIAAGLDYAHAHNIVHRDIKPSNILIDSSRHVFILDFGVAHIGGMSTDDEPIMGTPSYMSPEQILNKDVDYRSDLFSLAVLSFECFTGKRPFEGSDTTTVLKNILKGIRIDLTAAAPELPLALEAEFDRGLALEKEDRFPSGSEMIRAFRKALSISSGASNGPTVGYVPSDTKNTSSVFSDPFEANLESSDIKKWPASPGDALFGGAWSNSKAPASDSQIRKLKDNASDLEEPEGFSVKKDQYMNILIVFLAMSCVAIGCLIIWFLNGSPKPKVPSEVILPKVSVDDIVLYDFSTDNTSIDFKTQQPPPGKRIGEFDQPELLYLMLNLKTSESEIIEGLSEGLKKNIPDFALAACKLLEHDSYLVRLKALDVIGELRDSRATGKVVKLLEDYDASVRRKAAKTLGNIGDDRALGHLRASLMKENEVLVANEIRNAIQQLGQKS
ncbi:MAG: protein kinase [SAR324 cluster bacterium]|uniref:Protein kinase n=1 Tax=SAR324 cluster bacterium TaxID=2024889 RepID=A0A7X9ILF1_9DELT|nr:protein kinase [SAR324 cluster bacterium]